MIVEERASSCSLARVKRLPGRFCREFSPERVSAMLLRERCGGGGGMIDFKGHDKS
jgi:hypothetical protein